MHWNDVLVNLSLEISMVWLVVENNVGTIQH